MLDEAPIFTDVREFLQSGAARQYRGFADVVTAGFPCQPFSISGRKAGENDERNMWPGTISVIRTIRPKFCFMENVPGLLISGYFEKILSDLSEAGYSLRWGVLGADAFGLPHHRARLWMVAHAEGVNGNSWDMLGQSRKQPQRQFGRLPGTEISKDWRTANQGAVSVSIFRDPADGDAAEVGELKALGNGQVPICAAAAWKLLS